MESERSKENPPGKEPQTFEELNARIQGNFADLEDQAREMGQELQDAKAKTEGLGRRLLSDAPKPQ